MSFYLSFFFLPIRYWKPDISPAPNNTQMTSINSVRQFISALVKILDTTITIVILMMLPINYSIIFLFIIVFFLFYI